MTKCFSPPFGNLSLSLRDAGDGDADADAAGDTRGLLPASPFKSFLAGAAVFSGCVGRFPLNFLGSALVSWETVTVAAAAAAAAV